MIHRWMNLASRRVRCPSDGYSAAWMSSARATCLRRLSNVHNGALLNTAQDNRCASIHPIPEPVSRWVRMNTNTSSWSARTKAVFPLMALSRPASANKPSSMFNVVLICISLHDIDIPVKVLLSKVARVPDAPFVAASAC